VYLMHYVNKYANKGADLLRKADLLRVKLGFQNVFCVDCKGRSGGLLLFWSSDIDLEVQNFSQRHVNAVIHSSDIGVSWKFTGFYGHPDPMKRQESWSLLRCLADLNPSPWFVCGDFNEIISLSEKSSVSRRSQKQMSLFQSALRDCNLWDLGFKGQKYTWSNGRDGRDLTLERLDRAMANMEWSRLYNVVEVEILPRYCSDHSPLIITFDPASCKPWKKRMRFHFEAGWMKHVDHKKMVRKAWRIKNPTVDKWAVLKAKLDSCRNLFKRWARISDNKEKLNIKKVEEDLHKVQKEGDPENTESEKALKENLDLLVEVEDLKWRQRARENWLKYGDRNTKYFHACASQRKCRSSLKDIMDMEGRKWSSQKGIERAFERFFQWLYRAESNVEIDPCINSISPKVSAEMNQ